jgi:hypothetical protein
MCSQVPVVIKRLSVVYPADLSVNLARDCAEKQALCLIQPIQYGQAIGRQCISR